MEPEDLWLHWHGDPPDEVGNLSPGETVETREGDWKRRNNGKLYFRPLPEFKHDEDAVDEEPDEVEIVEADREIVPIPSVENPRRRSRARK